jgi:hypothetical protein
MMKVKDTNLEAQQRKCYAHRKCKEETKIYFHSFCLWLHQINKAIRTPRLCLFNKIEGKPHLSIDLPFRFD